jgi:nucleoside-diphosphate-sugar epimerase
MAKTAFIIGGTGQIGRAAALNLARHGWQVRVAHRGGRTPPPELMAIGVESVAVDRQDGDALKGAIGAGADLVLDCVAYLPDHANQLVALDRDVGAIAVVSSASVYRDEEGRTLDEAAQHGFPRFAGPIDERQPTVDPGPQTYSTNKVAVERILLNEARVPVTILRPCAIYGPGSTHPREWWFLKRALDGRWRVPVAFHGLSHFHTSATANIAEALRVSFEAGGSRILNVGDPSPPKVVEIGEAIAAAVDHDWEIVPLPGAPEGSVGRTPWSVPRPFLLDTSAADALGYEPATDYPRFVRETVQALREVAGARDWQSAFPMLRLYPYDLFDYAAEDDALAA